MLKDICKCIFFGLVGFQGRHEPRRRIPRQRGKDGDGHAEDTLSELAPCFFRATSRSSTWRAARRETPLIKLPPPFKNTPPIKVHTISNYDADGPYWAWNWLELGEHSGTHFDAPVHWITGKDYKDGTTDKLPVQKLVAPVNVIDCSKETAADEDFLLTADGVKAWESKHGEIKKGEWVVMRTGWFPRNRSEAEFLNVRDNMPHSPARPSTASNI